MKWRVFALFALGAAAALALAWAVGAVVALVFPAWTQWLVVAAAAIGIGFAAYAVFAPNNALFGRVVAGGRTRARVVALTFDDGPSPDVTPRILDALREHGVRATFFVLGRHAERHPEILRRIRDEGHELASHGYDHSLLAFARRRTVDRQLKRTEDAVEAATGSRPTPLFRAPHGYRSPWVVPAANDRGYEVVGWTKGVWDTALPGVQKIVDRSVRAFRSGGILLLHDADGSGRGADRSQTATAVPQIIEAGRRAGYDFATVSEVAALADPPRKRRTKLRAVLLVAGAILVFDIALRKFNLSALQRVDVAWWYVLLAVIANFASIFMKAVVWHITLEPVPGGDKAARYRHLIPALFIGFLLNTILLARVGEIARMAVLRRRLLREGDDIPVSVLAGTVLAEQITLGISLAVLLVGMLGVLSVPSWALRLLVALFAVLVVVGLAAAGLAALSRYRRRKHPGEPHYTGAWWSAFLAQAETLLHGLVRGQELFRHPLRFTAATLGGLLSWLAQIAAIYWALRAFGINHGAGAAALVFFTSTLVQLFPIVPGNIGLFQAAVIAPLQFSYNVDPTRALQFGIGLQLIEAVLGVGVGFLFLSREGLSLAEARQLRG